MATINSGRDPETGNEIIVIALDVQDYAKLRKGEGLNFGSHTGNMQIMIVDQSIHDADLPADQGARLQ